MLKTREATASINRKAGIAQQLLMGPINQSADLNELADWASALVLYGGAVLGAVHAKTNRPELDDQQAATMIRGLFLQGIAVGRNEGVP